METEERHSIWGVMLAPLKGLAYVIAMPFLAITFIVGIAIAKLVETVFGTLTAVTSFGWRPIESYFTGRKAKRGRRV